MIRKENIRSSRTRTASTLFYTKRSRVSRIRAITDTDTGEEKRTGVVPTLEYHSGLASQLYRKDTEVNISNIYTGGRNCVRFIIVSFNFLLNVNALSLGI